MKTVNIITKFCIFIFILFLLSVPVDADTPIDTLNIQAYGQKDIGASINSSVILENDIEYMIIISGTYQYKTGTEWGYADAQYRMGAKGEYNQLFNSIEFDGILVNADQNDIKNHTYTFYKKGNGKKLRFSIYDTTLTGERGDYDNNEGYLVAKIYKLNTLTLTKSVSPEVIELGQIATVTLTLKNTGDSEVKDITILDTISPYFSLANGNTDKNYDSIKPKDSRSYQYSIRASEIGTFSLEPAKVQLNYNINSNSPKITVIPSNTSTKKSASVQLHGEKTEVIIGEDVLLKLSAVNLITNSDMKVQVIILPPSGMSVTSSEFVKSGAGQFTTTYDISPGSGRDIEIRLKSAQVGDFEVEGRVIYYFGNDSSNAEDHTLKLPIKVNPQTQAQKSISGFELVFAFIVFLFLIKYYNNGKIG